MGNCQAIDSATLVIQHPNGKVDNFYWPIAASEVMKMNPGHYVALLLTTTLYSSPAAAPAEAKATATAITSAPSKNIPLRITRIKLLRPTDTLALGHVYRLVTYQEVTKGLSSKKQAKLKQQQPDKYGKIITERLSSSDFEAVVRKEHTNKPVKHESRQSKSRNSTQLNSGVAKSRAWQPSLKSISESAS